MRLIRWNAFVLLAVSLACHDSTGPRTISAAFALNNIDGRPLPTYIAPTPGLTPTVVSGLLILDETGQAVMTENRIEWNGVDATYTVNYAYEIRGDQITFSMLQPCPPNATCLAPPKGTISFGRLALEIGRLGNQPILYNYRPAPTL
jgi:hypothetical protein